MTPKLLAALTAIKLLEDRDGVSGATRAIREGLMDDAHLEEAARVLRRLLDSVAIRHMGGESNVIAAYKWQQADDAAKKEERDGD